MVLLADTLPWALFDYINDPEDEAAIKDELANKTKREYRLFCRQCHVIITTVAERITMQGKHEHYFCNPLGIEYHIGCFHQADGCNTIGTETMEHTWFSGYSWRIALCRQCHTHLGWSFTAQDHGFYGLILNRLTDRGPNGPGATASS